MKEIKLGRLGLVALLDDEYYAELAHVRWYLSGGRRYLIPAP